MDKDGKIIAIVNNKGGVGKTTASVNLANALGNARRDVLVVDMDSQCNATSLLLKRGVLKNSLHEILDGDGVDPGSCIYPTDYERLTILPNVEETSALEFELAKGIPASYQILRNRLRDYARANHDFTILDCPPNMGFFVVSALFAADFVLVPILSGSSFSIEGLVRATELIRDIQTNGNPDLRFLRLLVNNVDKRTAMSRVTLDLLGKHFGEDEVFKTSITTCTAFQQAESQKTTILRYAPTSAGAKAYRKLADEVLTIVTGPKAKRAA